MAKMKAPLIGIGITTHNRPEVLAHTLAQIEKFSPAKAKIVVVDDASEKPAAGATFRFETNVGIAAAKNKCFELLEDCDHIFLFDDDTYPKCKDWWVPYVESEEGHLAYIFQDFAKGAALNDTAKIFENEKSVAWSHQRGCMLYYKKECLEKIGGMDWRYGKWGYEHPNLADRIFNAGLTTFRYMDVINSSELIYSADEYQAIESTCQVGLRQRQIARNARMYHEGRNLSNYVDYRTPYALTNDSAANVVLTFYFTGVNDPQRNKKWEADYNALTPLIESLQGQKLVVIHDCFDVEDTETITHIKVPSITVSPYFARWIYARRWLSKHPEVKQIWCVDATDVVMLNNPFDEMQIGELYTGDENAILGCQWMFENHHAHWLQSWIKKNCVSVLLNAGLLGGDRESIMRFLNLMITFWEDNRKEIYFHGCGSVGESDMALFNFVAYSYFSNVLTHGRKVNTVFKRYQTGSGLSSWWKHK